MIVARYSNTVQVFTAPIMVENYSHDKRAMVQIDLMYMRRINPNRVHLYSQLQIDAENKSKVQSRLRFYWT
jgi:hypothetical protein